MISICFDGPESQTQASIVKGWKTTDSLGIDSSKQNGQVNLFYRKRNRCSKEIRERFEYLIANFDGPEWQTQASIVKGLKTTESLSWRARPAFQ